LQEIGISGYEDDSIGGKQEIRLAGYEDSRAIR
jgi:hypothetical protein